MKTRYWKRCCLLAIAVLLTFSSCVPAEETETESGIVYENRTPGKIRKKAAPVEFSLTDTFYTAASLEMTAEEGAEIRYTIDGSAVGDSSPVFRRKIPLLQRDGETVSCYSVRARALYPDGTWSEETVRSYFIGLNVDKRFDLPVFSVTIDPEDFTGENGIYTNFTEDGDEWERPGYLEMFDENGTPLLSQHCGIRLHGESSKKFVLKSLRFYARKEYEPSKRRFDYAFFPDNTDSEGKLITSYKRFILRSGGNDTNRLFLKDALCQTLAREYGYPYTEAVRPCSVYVNGSYYGFMWIQEYLGDRYFEDHYGDFQGEFVKTKTKQNAVSTKEENLEFLDLASLDLTDDQNLWEVRERIDLDSYLTYYAINILLDNEDWPQTNSVSFYYVPGKGEDYGNGVFDGRLRFLYHDNDMTFLAGVNHISKDCLLNVLNPNAVKHHSETLDLYSYSPLFAALMKREDLQRRFASIAEEMVSGVYSAENMRKTADRIVKTQENELRYYYSECANRGNASWSTYQAQLEEFRLNIPKLWPNLKRQLSEAFGYESEIK